MEEAPLHPTPSRRLCGPRCVRLGSGWGSGCSAGATGSGNTVGSYDLPSGAGQGQEVLRPRPFSWEPRSPVLFSACSHSEKSLNCPEEVCTAEGGCAGDSLVGRICLEHWLRRGRLEVQPPSCLPAPQVQALLTRWPIRWENFLNRTF